MFCLTMQTAYLRQSLGRGEFRGFKLHTCLQDYYYTVYTSRYKRNCKSWLQLFKMHWNLQKNVNINFQVFLGYCPRPPFWEGKGFLSLFTADAACAVVKNICSASFSFVTSTSDRENGGWRKLAGVFSLHFTRFSLAGLLSFINLK